MASHCLYLSIDAAGVTSAVLTILAAVVPVAVALALALAPAALALALALPGSLPAARVFSVASL